MIDKVKGFFIRNTTLKICSLILALLLWFYVQIVQNPEVSYDIFEVPITITGEADINSDGLVVGELPKNLKVNVTVSAKRSMINVLDASDFTAMVDVSSCTDAGKEYKIPVRVRSGDSEVSVVSKSPSSISVYIDRVINVEKDIKISYDGNLDQSYYIDKENVVINPQKATVRIPELDKKKVENVEVSVNMTGVRSTFTNIYSGVMLDKNNETVSDKNITLTTENISVTVPVYKRKTVPVVIKNVPTGIKYKLSSDEVEVAGREVFINSLKSVEGYIEGYLADEINSSYKVTLKLDDLILTEEKEITFYPLAEEN